MNGVRTVSHFGVLASWRCVRQAIQPNPRSADTRDQVPWARAGAARRRQRIPSSPINLSKSAAGDLIPSHHGLSAAARHQVFPSARRGLYARRCAMSNRFQAPPQAFSAPAPAGLNRLTPFGFLPLAVGWPRNDPRRQEALGARARSHARHALSG